MGFSQGHKLHDPEGYLQAGKKKVMRSKKFKTIQEIDFERLRAFLFQADLIDKEKSISIKL